MDKKFGISLVLASALLSYTYAQDDDSLTIKGGGVIH